MISVLASGARDLPALTVARIVTSWQFEPLVLLGLVAAGGVYLYGVRQLRRRGDEWAGMRVGWWMLGLLTIFIATSSSVAVYDTTLFSVHTVQHLLLQIAAPVPLGFAAPITLALRTLPLRARKKLLVVLHSRIVHTVTHPMVVFGLFSLSPFALYYTPLFEATLRTEWLHNVTHVHFLIVGSLLYWTIIGVDPLPHRLPPLAGFMFILALAPMHVLLGIPLMVGTELLGGDVFRAARDWGPDPLADQQTGGALLWVFGDIAVMLFLPGFFKQWARSDRRETKRIDRQLDRQYGSAATSPPWWLPPSPAEAPVSASEATQRPEPQRR